MKLSIIEEINRLNLFLKPLHFSNRVIIKVSKMFRHIFQEIKHLLILQQKHKEDPDLDLFAFIDTVHDILHLDHFMEVFLELLPIVASLLALKFVFIFHLTFEYLDHLLKEDPEFLRFGIFFGQTELVGDWTVVFVFFTSSVVKFHYLFMALSHRRYSFNVVYLIEIVIKLLNMKEFLRLSILLKRKHFSIGLMGSIKNH